MDEVGGVKGEEILKDENLYLMWTLNFFLYAIYIGKYPKFHQFLIKQFRMMYVNIGDGSDFKFQRKI